MKVFGTWVDTSPKQGGLRFIGGDVCQPIGGGMLSPPWAKTVLRFYMPLPILPFLCVKLGKYGFYIGAKVYGNNDVNYKNWMSPEDYNSGGLAMVLTARFFTDG